MATKLTAAYELPKHGGRVQDQEILFQENAWNISASGIVGKFAQHQWIGL